MSRRWSRRSTLALAQALALVGCGGAPRTAPSLRLATTTSTDNSGLLDALLPVFEAREGVTLQRLVVGTGQALKLGRDGEVDVVLVHARAREDEFIAQGYGVDRRDVMWNDFVVLGPPSDPAGIRGTTDARAALQAIATSGAAFYSRGDDSGTHMRERALWTEGGATRPAWSGYREVGQGMGACLTIANEKRGYVLSDRGTFLAYRGELELEVLVEGDARLRNPYGVMLVNPARHPHVEAELGTRLLDFLVSDEGQRRIAEFRVNGQVLFHPHRATLDASTRSG